MIKKILKILLTILFIVGLIFSINNLINNYFEDALMLIVLAFTMFVLHLFAWIAPKAFFNLCWKISDILPDDFDYDTSFRKLESVDLGILIVSNIFLVLGMIIM